MPSGIEQDFHRAMLGIYQAALEECGYRATRFRQMVLERGGVQAAKALLASADISDGLTKLWEKKRLDISMEALVLKGKWAALFNPDELVEAKRRLASLGYTVQAE